MSNLSENAIHVINIELPTKSNTSDKTDERDNWWEYNIAEQFPVKSRREANGPTHIEVDKPHEGCLIKTTMKNGKMDGESSIYSKDNILMATLTFVDGIASGPCTICKNGILFYKGYFVNGYREGRGQEYDENGKLVYDGFYKKGKKQTIVPSNEMGKGYWKELDEHGRIIQISQKDEFGNNEGFCYSYDCGKISRVSVWKEGKEVTVLKEFGDDIMIEYENGRKVYEGGFVDSLEMGYPRNDENIRVVKTGNTNIQKGNFKIIIHNMKTVISNGSLLKNRYVSVIVAVISIIVFFVYFIAFYLENGPYGIGFDQELYIVETGSRKYFTKFELSNYPNLKRIEIGDNCFIKVKSFKIDGLDRLNRLIIGDESYTQMRKAEWDNVDSYDEAIKLYSQSESFRILNCESLELIQIGQYSFSNFGGEFELKNLPQLQYLIIGDGTFKMSPTFDISNITSLRSVNIGDDCFGSVQKFQIDGLNRLQSLKIGKNSFTDVYKWYLSHSGKSFHILNCELLASIQIGDYSFSDFAGEFELKNLPQLQSILIGTIGSYHSNNFYCSSFVLRGIELI